MVAVADVGLRPEHRVAPGAAADDRASFDHAHRKACPRQVRSAHQAVVPSADDDHIEIC